MKRFILIRHTRTQTPEGACHGGGTELTLAASFQEESAFVKTQIPAQITHYYTSPLDRCRRLAELGDWEGKLWKDLAGPQLDSWMADFVNIAPPGGESTVQALERVRPFLEDLTDGVHLAVTHGGLMRIIIASVLQIPLNHLFQVDVPYACVVVLSFKQGCWTLEKLVAP
jgi:alpha-ribazole phosphatase